MVRICTSPENRDKRLQELKFFLLDRGYSELLVNNSIEKARLVPREKELKKEKSSFCC